MAHKSPQLVGVGLFIIVSLLFLITQIFPANIVSPVPDVLSIRTSRPLTVHFGEILAKEYTESEKRKIETSVLGASVSASLAPSSTPTIAVGKLDKFDLVSSKSGSITIALLGDSMVDTLQKDLPQLKILLAQAYPNINQTLLNFGVGATNIEQGLTRLTSDYDYLGDHHPSLLSTNPDIVVIESFAYNPWSNSQSDLDRQWTTLGKIVDTIKSLRPKAKIVLAATIAPNGNIFGDGILNWPLQDKKNKALTIKSYL